MIAAEGEHKASRALRHAAEVIAESPSALQVDTITSIIRTTIIITTIIRTSSDRNAELERSTPLGAPPAEAAAPAPAKLTANSLIL